MKSKINFNYKIFLIVFFCLILFLKFSFVYLLNEPNKNYLKVTLEHPFYINGNWIKASDLKVGDELTTADGKTAKITKITKVKTDKLLSVYNLEVNDYENYITSNRIIVHNSNLPHPNEFNYFELNWGRSSRNLAFTTDDQGNSVRVSKDNMVEKIIIDHPHPPLEEIVKREYARTLGSLQEGLSEEDLKKSLLDFDMSMREKLPFLGKQNIDAVRDSGHMKRLLYEYLKQSETGIPRLSTLGEKGMLDCTAQALTIRESLGGSASNWLLYRDVTKRGEERVHTFLAKKFKLNNGNIVYGIIDPSESILYGRPLVIAEKEFEAKYPLVQFSRIKL